MLCKSRKSRCLCCTSSLRDKNRSRHLGKNNADEENFRRPKYLSYEKVKAIIYVSPFLFLSNDGRRTYLNIFLYFNFIVLPCKNYDMGIGYMLQLRK